MQASTEIIAMENSSENSTDQEIKKFKKRKGTAGISGHLFETKLLSLLYFRAIYNDKIKEFQLSSNVDNMGAFDDICFQAEVKDFDRPILVFIQAKHRENKKQMFKIDLETYFPSYLKVRKQFHQCDQELFFKKTFDETDCFFVLYTTARDEFSNDSKVESGIYSILNALIGTEGTVKQPYKLVEDVEFLCKVAIKEQMISLAERIAKFIIDDSNFKDMLNDELIQRYHVILAQTAVEVSGIQPQGLRIASFRQDFFDIDDEYLTTFKETLFKEILKKPKKIKTSDVKKILSEFFNKPSDTSILSKLVGTVIIYNNNNGQFVLDNKIINEFRPEMKTIDVPRSTVDKAVELAAKEILLSPKFKLRVPAAFGNKDLTLSGTDERKQKRIKHLSSTIINLLDNCTSNRIVTIDETLGDGILKLNGGIAGAVGNNNILVLDDDTKLMKITNNVDALGSLAKSLYKTLNDDIELINQNRVNNKILSLSEYKFRSTVYKFPKLLLEWSEYKEEAKDFLNKLVIFSNQADEEDVENFLKTEIEENQFNQPNYLRVHTDAIFSKYHDEMQKWWKLPEHAPFLTRENNLFLSAKRSIIKDPLLTVVTAMYHNKIKPIQCTFTEDAVSSLNLQNPPSNTVIITENSILTVVKVLQHLKKIDHVLIDMAYIVRLPANDRIVLREELTHVDKVVILVCDDMQKDTNIILENIAKAVLDKTTIIVTNNASVKILQKYFKNPPVHDDENSLINMSEESQKSILEDTRVMFQDTEVRLDLIIDDNSKKFVKGDVLTKIVNEESIAVGKLIVKENYNEIKPLHVDRRLRKLGDDNDMALNTFKNIPDEVVLVTAGPGMGKSTLLTHLSIQTKESKPEIWIVRINLLEYSREFSRWKEENTAIDILETLKFLCQVILRHKLGKENKVEFTLEEKDTVVHLKHCTADPLIELELNLFLHFYYEKEIIFLFDGFDEICPHYMDVVLKCLKCLRDHHKQRMWITSRLYNEIKIILEGEFGLPYELLFFTDREMFQYLATFWKKNLNFTKLNLTQRENVKKFLDYMAEMKNKRIPLSKPLHAVFKIAASYLDFEMTNKSHENYSIEKLNCYESPLFLYLAAFYVVDNIENKHSEEWYLDVDTFKVYVRFLEVKIRRRYEEKNEMNIYYPDIISAYNKEIADSTLKHKKLGAYAIFYKLDGDSTLFNEKDLEEIKEMIKDLEKGENRTGLIDSVANGIPIFTHMSFTEYFAVEFVCDRLKMDSNREKLEYFYVLFTKAGFANVRKIFNDKLNVDEPLMSSLEQNEDAILNWMLSFTSFDGPQFRLVYDTSYDNLSNLRSFIDKMINNNSHLPNKTIVQQANLFTIISILNNGKNIEQYIDDNFEAFDSMIDENPALLEAFSKFDASEF